MMLNFPVTFHRKRVRMFVKKLGNLYVKRCLMVSRVKRTDLIHNQSFSFQEWL